MILGIIIAFVAIFAAVIAVIVLHMRAVHHASGDAAGKKHEKASQAALTDELAKQTADDIFDEKFREELRNRGRLHFEKIIGENAMFLQQDLRLTTSQLNDYMKTEITTKLKDEFEKYEQSIVDAKELAVDSIHKTNEVIDEQRKTLSTQLHLQLEAEKKELMSRFEQNMASVVNHYVLQAIGNQIDLSDQLEYIMGELESNKKAIAEDISRGA